MVSISDLKRIHVLSDMPEDMLKRIASIARLYLYSADMRLFERDEPLKSFYMIHTGQVSLTVDLGTDVNVVLGTLGPGHSCGVSAFLPESRSGSRAVCDEPSELIVLPAEDVFILFQEDSNLAYQFMRRVVRLFKAIIDHRTSMILRSLRDNSGLQDSLKQACLTEIL